ncbi:MAG: hypothetical protein NTW32_02540 [Chloroflexi bacterium]|nr:hypothetical protein [Chloroflexota bacterium]
MKHIYIPTASPEDWRKLLADPEKHWKPGYSAWELAHHWEDAKGFPSSLLTMFANSENPALQKLELLLATPEYRVGMAGGGHASQNDLFILAKAADGNLISITVEGKVNESFGPTVKAWLQNPSPGKKKRLEFLLASLGLVDEISGDIRYQLFHRTVSALVEAERFNAPYAMMIVQSFSPDKTGFKDYQAFLGLFGQSSDVGELVELLPESSPVRLFSGWVSEKGVLS